MVLSKRFSRNAGMLSVLCWLAGAGAAAAAGPGIKTKPGELVIDPPTLINLGFEWPIEGDDNRNASVEVSYRRTGESQWKQGLPLLRLQGERIFQTEGVFDVISPNMFAGSILDLEPDTAYEARFTMSDPDGFAGQAGKVGGQDRHGSHPAGAEALLRRARVPRVSAELHRAPKRSRHSTR